MKSIVNTLDLKQLYHLVDLLILDNLSQAKNALSQETLDKSRDYNNKLIAILRAEINRR